MSNAPILAQLEKFARDINAETMSLNQRVPGSSPGAPTKQNQAVAMLANQNGLFSLKNSPRMAAIRTPTYDFLRFLVHLMVRPGWLRSTTSFQRLWNDRFWRAPCKGGAFQWVQTPPGNRSSRKQSEQSWR
jgi:hypothetical protein